MGRGGEKEKKTIGGDGEIQSVHSTPLGDVQIYRKYSHTNQLTDWQLYSAFS